MLPVLCLVGGAVVAVGSVVLIFMEKKLNLLYQRSHPPEKGSEKHGGEIVASVLKAHGVDFLFTLCGGHISPIAVGCEKVGIRVIDTRHEVTAAFAADAVSRLSRGIGVAVVTAGPGVTNTVTAIKNAQMAESPLLLMGGAAATIVKGRGALQDIDHLALMRPICKYVATVSCVRDIAPTLRRAISEAKSGTPGPVFVELPIDVLYPYNIVEKEAIGGNPPPKSLMSKFVMWYLKRHVGNVFAGAFEPRPVEPLPLSIPHARDSEIQRAAEILSRSKKPVILVGSQALLPPTCLSDIVKAIEHFGAPVFLGGMARGLLGGEKFNVQIRHNRKNVLKTADCVILAGTVCDFRLGYGRTINKHAKIIAVNRSKTQLMLNSDAMWKPSVAMVGDVGNFLVRLAAALPAASSSWDPKWLSTWHESDKARDAEILKQAAMETDKGLNPLNVLLALDEALDSGKSPILIGDGGDFVGAAAYITRPRGPLGWLDPGPFGTLGSGGGFALGAKLVRPDSDVWIIYGDGSLGYSMMEFDTYVRHGINISAVVGNDACWSQICREQIPMFGTPVSCMLAHTDYHLAVEALGGSGRVIDRDMDNSKVKTALIDAANVARTSKKPVLVNVIIGKTNFREGSISV